jgi:dolichol-phosphate mannosyltransferase
MSDLESAASCERIAHPVAPSLCVAVVVPCYRVREHILQVLAAIPPLVQTIVCVDDGCPEQSGRFIQTQCEDPRVKVLFHRRNRGVGAAIVTGYRAAMSLDADIIVKLDGDGQMDPGMIPRFVIPILDGAADYTKGNRFYSPDSLAGMPPIRLLGNALLSFLGKLSTGYWNIFDQTNGYTAIHVNVLRLLPLRKLSDGYFFETDMLFRLATIRAVVHDVPMVAKYGTAKSNMSISRIVGPFLMGHIKNFFKRFVYNYLMRDFNVASVEILVGWPLLTFGLVFGSVEWLISERTGVPATAGTVMLAALPIIVGLQMLLSALSYDVMSVPNRPIHRTLGDRLSIRAKRN